MNKSKLKSSALYLLFSACTLTAFANGQFDACSTLSQLLHNKIAFTARHVNKSQLPTPFDFILTQPIMTTGLEQYYNQQIKVKKLCCQTRNGIYSRTVQLELATNKHPVVEFALININTQVLHKKVIHQIRSTTTPFGKILATNRIRTTSHIKEYFALKCNSLLQTYTHCKLNSTIYGRSNVIIDSSGNWLAKVIEIVPGTAKPASANPTCYRFQRANQAQLK